MISAVLCLTMIDILLGINVFGFLPVEWQDVMAKANFNKLAIAELFAILFAGFEAISVMKNMALCGVPLPKGLRKKIEQWLDKFTDEANLPESEEQE